MSNSETNQYAEIPSVNIVDLVLMSLLEFIGMLILMDILQLPYIKMYRQINEDSQNIINDTYKPCLFSRYINFLFS